VSAATTDIVRRHKAAGIPAVLHRAPHQVTIVVEQRNSLGHIDNRFESPHYLMTRDAKRRQRLSPQAVQPATDSGVRGAEAAQTWITAVIHDTRQTANP
jgi:hypothetical protein